MPPLMCIDMCIGFFVDINKSFKNNELSFIVCSYYRDKKSIKNNKLNSLSVPGYDLFHIL